MAVQRHSKGALRKGAPFAFLQGVFLLVVLFLALPSGACPLDHADETASVSYVYDGDTIKLADGRKVRFIGINTTEINHDGGASEPYAQAARKRLMALLGDGRVVLRFDEERHDHYGRTLAHPYLPDGRSISRILLDEGLAAAVVLPPNTWQSDCYLSHEQRARQKRLGLWSGKPFLIRQSTALAHGQTGFTLLQGRVEEVDESRKSLWLELTGNVALRIPKHSLHYFTSYDPWKLTDKNVEARGWLTYYKGKWRMTVRHPNALELR